MKLHNPLDRTVTGVMTFTPRNQSAGEADVKVPFSIPPKAVNVYSDVYATAHPGASGADRVLISMDTDPTTTRPFAPPIVDTATYNLAADGGEFGQNPTVFALDALYYSGSTYDAILGKSGERDGLFVVTGSGPVTIEWTYADATGGSVFTTTSSYGANMTFQYTGGVQQLLGFEPAPNGSLAAKITAGRARVALTHNNNQTNDPRWTDFEYRSSAKTTSGNADKLVPIVAHVGGQLGSVWRSDLKLLNPYSWPMTGTLVFTPRGQVESASDPTMAFSLQPRTVQVFTDVHAAVHAGASGADRVLVRMDTDPATTQKLMPPVVESCTYNLASNGGEFGQNPTIRRADGTVFGLWLVPGGTGVVVLGKIGERDGLFVVTADQEVTIEWVNTDVDGVESPAMTRSYTANTVFQYTGGVKELLGFEPRPNGTLRGTVVAGKARFALTHNNNQTNDPRWIDWTLVPPYELDGSWAGTVSTGGKMTFNVVDGRFPGSYYIEFGGCSPLVAIGGSSNSTLTGRVFEFSYTTTFPFTYSVLWKGTFDTATTAHGTVWASTCTTELTWTAAKQ